MESPAAQRSLPVSRGKTRGFALSEVLVALVIGLIVVGAASEVMMASKKSFRVEDGQSRLQENARFAMHALEEEIRGAGYQGCRSVSLVPPRVVANGPMLPLSAASVLQVHDGQSGDWSPALSAGLTTLNSMSSPALPKIKAQTDVVTVQSAESCNGRLVAAMTGSLADVEITLSNSCQFAVGDVAIIADCRSSDIFRISAVTADTANGKTVLAHDGSQNSNAALSKVYPAGAEVLRLRAFSYFVGTGSDGEPDLWRFDNTRNVSTAAGSENPQPIGDEVEDLQVQLGIDGDGDGGVNQAVNAAAVTDWNSVLSVRLDVLFRSQDDNVLTSAQSYAFDGQTALTATDRRLHRSFVATVGLRNRLQ